MCQEVINAMKKYKSGKGYRVAELRAMQCNFIYSGQNGLNEKTLG